MSNKHMGSSIDDFLKEEGIFDETQAQAVKEVVFAWQLADAMKTKKISKSKRWRRSSRRAARRSTRLLDPKNDITFFRGLQKGGGNGRAPNLDRTRVRVMDASSRKIPHPRSLAFSPPAILSAQPQNYTTLVTFNAANGAGSGKPH